MVNSGTKCIIAACFLLGVVSLAMCIASPKSRDIIKVFLKTNSKESLGMFACFFVIAVIAVGYTVCECKPFQRLEDIGADIAKV